MDVVDLFAMGTLENDSGPTIAIFHHCLTDLQESAVIVRSGLCLRSLAASFGLGTETTTQFFGFL